MSSTGDQPPPIRPSVFISYASQDRAQAKLLSGAFAEAGLDVWFDENELTGGDTWDQKIRQQLRECDFFVAVISASTEARKEGYFRREWRLAAERTIDMADDVMFLLPVVIDATNEATARVPDKFLSVQWLRCPGGAPNSALKSVAQRMAKGTHAVPVHARIKKSRNGKGPKIIEPLPAFPDNPGHENRLKYYAHIVGWLFMFSWAFLQRLPKVIRVLLIIFLVFAFLRQCSRDEGRPKPSSIPKPPATAKHKLTAEEKAEAIKNVQAVTDGLKKAGINFDGSIPQILNEALSSNDEKKTHVLTMTPFDLGVTDEATAKLARSIFSNVFLKLASDPKAGLGLNPKEFTATSDEALDARAKELHTRFLSVSSLEGTVLTVRLFDADDDEKTWKSTYELKDGDAETIATKMAADLLAALPNS